MLKWPQTVPSNQQVLEHELLELRQLRCRFDLVPDETFLKKPREAEVQKVTCIHGKTLSVSTARRVLGLSPWNIPFQQRPLPTIVSEPLSLQEVYDTLAQEETSQVESV